MRERDIPPRGEHELATGTATLHVGGLHYAGEKAVVERSLGRRPGVLAIDANPVAQTATVTFDRAITSVEELARWVEECGYHCAGQSAPGHYCDPMSDAVGPAHGHDSSTTRADDAHGQGHGGHAGMSMAAMARDMRNRFLVAAICAIPIALWSPLGDSLFGSTPATPFGIGDELWQFVLSLPVIFYASLIFFRGAYVALRARTLDMMVLVAVAIGTGWVYSVAATFWIAGDVFYEAAAFLAAFVLLGHWFEMRARGGANEAIRALLDLAPPKAIVIRDGQEVEVPTAEVQVGDLLLIRPGSKVAVDAEVLEGESSVDESMVTGESMPVSKQPGGRLIGATINKQGTLRARATAVGSDTALAQIVKLVQEAQNSKAPAQRLADRAAFWLVLLLFLLIYLFESKRRQRIIPVSKPNKNSSLDFVKTVGRLYYQYHDNKNLGQKMTAHLFDHIRTRYNLSTTVLDENFVNQLAYKSGYDKEKVHQMVYRAKMINDFPEISDHDLSEFHKQTEAFYKFQ